MAGANPIQFSEIEAWLDSRDIRSELREMVHYAIAQLDGQYMVWLAEKMKKDKK
jgi:hypothetical protein